MNKEEFIRQLDSDEEARSHLFEKGFLITNRVLEGLDSFPFYGNWTQTRVGEFTFCLNNKTRAFFLERYGKTFFLLGHAYDPIGMIHDENALLSDYAEAYCAGEGWNAVNRLTGIFIMGVVEGDSICFWLDASGMQYGCYGVCGGNMYITSHMRLIGDIDTIKEDEYVAHLVKYRWYRYMMGNYLPGELSCYREIRRIIPNTAVRYSGGDFATERFYPCREINMCRSEQEYQSVIEEAAEIMKNTMTLIARKWEKPAISLTGGIDSNTTFAAANGNYDRYCAFSYISMYRESVDAEKAKQISERFGVPHATYIIPSENAEIDKFELYKAVLLHNDGDIGPFSESDLRKKIYLIQSDVCEVEVKSWISETIRAYAYKYFGRKHFPKSLSRRNYTSLYKIFVLNRKLVRQTDERFGQYLENTCLKEHLYNYDETDLFVWEMMHGGKCGLDIGVMRSCFDITIPYNNRYLLDLLLRVPLEKRISDQSHLDMKKLLNRELYDMNIRVVNLNETESRKKLLNAYYTINSFLPF